MKKTLALILAVLMLVCLFAGCGSSSAPAAAPAASAPAKSDAPAAPAAADAAPAKPYEGKTIHILMEDVPDTAYVQELVPLFEEETGIKVEIESISYSTMHEKLAAQLIAGAVFFVCRRTALPRGIA